MVTFLGWNNTGFLVRQLLFKWTEPDISAAAKAKSQSEKIGRRKFRLKRRPELRYVSAIFCDCQMIGSEIKPSARESQVEIARAVRLDTPLDFLGVTRHLRIGNESRGLEPNSWGRGAPSERIAVSRTSILPDSIIGNESRSLKSILLFIVTSHTTTPKWAVVFPLQRK